MKQNIQNMLKTVCFITLLMGLLILASYIFEPKNNYKEFGMNEIEANGILGEKEETIDVVVVGDSETYSAISPMQLWEEHGMTSYVCGTSGQPMNLSLQFVETVFERQSPKVIIMETNAIYRKNDIGSFLLSRVESAFSIFQYHDRWKSITANDFGGKVNYTYTNDYKGYRYNAKIASSSKKDYMIQTDQTQTIPTANILCLNKIASLCEKNNATLLLVSTPSSKNWNYQKHNGIQEYADEKGLCYLDMNLINDEILINWKKDTRDKGDHLNYTGAKKVSNYLGNYLKDNYNLNDYRGQGEYSSWDKSLKKYKKLISKNM